MTVCTSDCVAPRENSPQTHCATCHHTFGGIRGFDDHRIATTSGHQVPAVGAVKACVHPATLDMAQDARGVWRRQDYTGDGPSARRSASESADPPSAHS